MGEPSPTTISRKSRRSTWCSACAVALRSVRRRITRHPRRLNTRRRRSSLLYSGTTRYSDNLCFGKFCVVSGMISLLYLLTVVKYLYYLYHNILIFTLFTKYIHQLQAQTTCTKSELKQYGLKEIHYKYCHIAEVAQLSS